ncbi:hypothetical protein SDC9_198010 [bioreactor metagenome]|uniref:Uncharacterized protein n=1 Tax=bioreactor metagenome TaxID=1076179 RepID=A0A645IPW3_9ZZZZ
MLPLYKDEVCSDESRRFLEEHIQACPDCAKELEKIKEDIVYKPNADGMQAMRAVALKWKNDKKIYFLIGSFFVSFIAAIGCSVSYSIQGSYVDASGLLVEPFYLIPLTFLFGLLSIVFLVALFITLLVRHLKIRRLLKNI